MAFAPHVEYAAHNSGGRFIHYQSVVVVRVSEEAIRCVTADILSRLECRLLDRFNFVARIFGASVIYDVFENHQHVIVVRYRINSVLQGDKPTPNREENNVRKTACFDIIPTNP